VVRSVKTRIQASQDEGPSLSKQQKKTVLGLILRIWHKEGVPGFFKGFSANMINTFSMRTSDSPCIPITIFPLLIPFPSRRRIRILLLPQLAPRLDPQAPLAQCRKTRYPTLNIPGTPPRRTRGRVRPNLYDPRRSDRYPPTTIHVRQGSSVAWVV
jgi:hypothetical protein